MCDFLDNFNFDSVDNETLSAMINSAENFIRKATAKRRREDNYVPSPPLPSGVMYSKNFLQGALLKQLKCDLSKLTYLSTGVHQPGVCLFGQHRYVYNKATANLQPVPFGKVPCIGETLQFVNNELNTNYNSILVNKYHSKNTALEWHQDNEPEVDQSHSISTLSIGAERRFLIANNRNDGDKGDFSSTVLSENSVLMMKAGLQGTHYHKVVSGSVKSECGVRYSLTFRRLLPGNESPLRQQQQQPQQQPPKQQQSTQQPKHQQQKKQHEQTHQQEDKHRHEDCFKAIVIGSSLTKGLNDKRLSAPGKSFMVICHPGARVGTIIKSVESKIKNKTLCLDCIQNVFLICGGNDVENIRTESGLNNLLGTYNTLICLISDYFLNAMIDIVSLIPRRLKDSWHLDRILSVNENLMYECIMHNNCRYIDIFSHFLKYKKRFHAYNEVHLNEDLYEDDILHFSNKGNSVIAKVIMGVAYNPY